jgi:hypothetical protein
VRSWAVSAENWNNTLRTTEYKDTPHKFNNTPVSPLV